MDKDDSKIIKFGDYCHNINENDSSEVIDLASQTVEEVLKFLNGEGYNISDPQFLLDFEVVYTMLQGAMCRQKGLNCPGIKLLDFIEDDQPA